MSKIQIYPDANGRWRWRVKSRNGRVTAASEQGYKSYYYALLKSKLAGGLGTDVQRLSVTPVDSPDKE